MISVVVQVAIQKPDFFEEVGLLWAKLYHYRDFLQLACSRLGNDNDTGYSEAIAPLDSSETRRRTQSDQLQRRVYHFACWRLAHKHHRPLTALWYRIRIWLSF